MVFVKLYNRAVFSKVLEVLFEAVILNGKIKNHYYVLFTMRI